MGWFSRLKDKFRRKFDDVVYEEDVPRETPKPVLRPVEVPKPVVEITAEGQQYLKENPDVAAHSYFCTRPEEHYEAHGRAEGRRWPVTTIPRASLPVGDQEINATVLTPGGRQFPVPDPRENAFGYIGRVGAYLGRTDEWNRVSGTLFLGTDSLVPKNVKYPDDYAAWKEDPANWPTMAENFWFRPAQVIDPGWNQVHEQMKKPRKPAKKPAPPQDETPL